MDSLESVGGSCRFPNGSETLASGPALPVAIDLGLLLGMAAEALNCLMHTHNTIVFQMERFIMTEFA